MSRFLCISAVFASDLTVAPDRKMPANKLNKQEGFQLSNPTAFLTDRPGAFATWLAATFARCTEFGVGPNDIFGCNLTTTEMEDFDKADFP